MLIELASIVTLHHTPRDDSYYLVCAAFNLAIILILPWSSKTGLVIDLQKLNLIALFCQLFGFLSYWYEIPVQIYNLSIHFLSALQLLRLLITRKGDADGIEQNNSWLSVVRHYYLHRDQSMFKKESK